MMAAPSRPNPAAGRAAALVGLADWDAVAAAAVPRTDWMAEVAAASSVLLGLAYILWQKSVATFVAEDRSSGLQPEER